MAERSIRLERSGFVWHELMSTDPKQSEEFYRRVAGVSVTPLGEGPDAYLMLMAGDQPVGGVAGPRPDQEGWPSGGPEAHWIAYFGTDDVDAAARTAEELGGEVLLPPTDVPGMGRAAVLRDPQGAAFGGLRLGLLKVQHRRGSHRSRCGSDHPADSLVQSSQPGRSRPDS